MFLLYNSKAGGYVPHQVEFWSSPSWKV